MKAIDEQRLEIDLEYRYEFLAEFIGFNQEDIAAIRASAMFIGPKIPQIVNATYEKLLAYDATARHFVAKQHGFAGQPPKSLDALSMEHEQIRFRKDHLTRYFMNLLGHAYNHKIATYLDAVGKMHTPGMGNKVISVPLVQMNALMGVISDVLFETIMHSNLQPEIAYKTTRAFNKLLWIQNDFITRHYAHKAE